MKMRGLNPELRPLRHFRPILWKPLLPFMNALLSILPHTPGREVRVTKRTIPVKPGARISVSIIEPRGLQHPAPCLVFCHGGAFVLKAAPHHHRLTKGFALRAPCVVILPDYRLSPRHPFPAPLEDCYAAYEWTIANAAALGIDPARIAVGGDSVGGSLAASVCLLARDRYAPAPCVQMLLYPVTDRRMQSKSMQTFLRTPMWNARLNARMWKTYLSGSASWPVYYASPMEAPSLTGLPNAYLETAQLDPLRDEGLAYAAALQKAGAIVEQYQAAGALHGFDFLQRTGLVKQCMNNRVAALQQAFSSRR